MREILNENSWKIVKSVERVSAVLIVGHVSTVEDIFVQNIDYLKIMNV